MNQPNPPTGSPASYNPGYQTKVSRLNDASAKWQRYKLLLLRRWWLLLLGASIGVCVMAWRVYSEPERYVSFARLVAGGHFRNLHKGPSYVEYTHEFFGTAIEVLQSHELRSKAADRVESFDPDIVKCGVTPQIDRPTSTSIINVSMTGNEPEYTQKYLDALLQEFMAYRKRVRENASQATLNLVTEELIRLDKSLQKEEAKVLEFKERNNLLLLNQKDNTAANYLRDLRTKKAALVTELSLLDLLDPEADIERRARRTGMTGEEIDEEVSNLLSAGLGSAEVKYLEAKQRMTMLKADRDNLLRSLKERHPSVLEVDEAIMKELRMLDLHREQSLQEAKRRRQNLEFKMQNLDTEMARYEKEALAIGAKLAQFERLSSGKERYQKRYNEYLEMLEDIDATGALTTDFMSILQKATGATRRTPDFIQPLLMGLGLGTLVGLVVIFLFDKLDDRMNSFSEFQAHFHEDVLGQIPDQNFRGDSPLLRVNDDRHLYAEAFRNLRSSILFKDWQGDRPKLIAVASSVPNEGKTTAAANLAFTMATSGSRVLLVDADLRRGGMNELYGLPSAPGLSEVLTEGEDWKACLRETGTENLEFLPRGKALDQTSEHLLSDRCRLILSSLRDEYDFVIFDTAPVLVADDTASFAPAIDTTIFVIRMGSTMARMASKALDQLYGRQVDVGGVLLNRASTSLKEYSYYNYANYYTAQPLTPPSQ